MKVSKDFTIQEFVPREVFEKWGDKSTWFIDPRLIQLVQALREEFGPITINGGTYNYSGYRPPECTIGAKASQHRFGRGADLKFKAHTVQEVYDAILKNEAHWMSKGLTTLENIKATPTWLHVDIRSTLLKSILIVNP